MKQKLMWIVWPSFLMAGVLELLVFAVVDPQDMHWFGQPFEISRQAIYSLGFFVFWVVTSLAGGLTLFLSLPPHEVNHHPL
jgi:uncharacterized membrane protein YcfT